MAKKNLKKINDKDAPVKVKLVAPEGTFATIEIEGKVCFLKKPSRATYAKVIPMLTPMLGGEVNIMGAGELILRECFSGGDQEFLTDDDYIIAGAIQCVGLIELKEATLKKN